MVAAYLIHTSRTKELTKLRNVLIQRDQRGRSHFGLPMLANPRYHAGSADGLIRTARQWLAFSGSLPLPHPPFSEQLEQFGKPCAPSAAWLRPPSAGTAPRLLPYSSDFLRNTARYNQCGSPMYSNTWQVDAALGELLPSLPLNANPYARSLATPRASAGAPQGIPLDHEAQGFQGIKALARNHLAFLVERYTDALEGHSDQILRPRTPNPVLAKRSTPRTKKPSFNAADSEPVNALALLLL